MTEYFSALHKLKVGADLGDDIRRLSVARAAVNENIAVLLLAAKFGVPVCPHAGGVGLCEMVQHLAMFDFLAVSGSWDGRVIEYVDHLHEHFVEPVRIERGRYVPPRAPGAGAQMRPESVADYLYPTGPRWRDRTPQLAEATNVADT